jgi:hypothetical protein
MLLPDGFMGLASSRRLVNTVVSIFGSLVRYGMKAVLTA